MNDSGNNVGREADGWSNFLWHMIYNPERTDYMIPLISQSMFRFTIKCTINNIILTFVM